MTESGTDDGQVATVEFDESGYRLSHVEVSPGFIKGNKHVPASHVTSLGGDVVVVADDVVAESAPVSVDPA